MPDQIAPMVESAQGWFKIERLCCAVTERERNRKRFRQAGHNGCQRSERPFAAQDSRRHAHASRGIFAGCLLVKGAPRPDVVFVRGVGPPSAMDAARIGVGVKAPTGLACAGSDGYELSVAPSRRGSPFLKGAARFFAADGPPGGSVGANCQCVARRWHRTAPLKRRAVARNRHGERVPVPHFVPRAAPIWRRGSPPYYRAKSLNLLAPSHDDYAVLHFCAHFPGTEAMRQEWALPDARYMLARMAI
jgi:hypothetical protein